MTSHAATSSGSHVHGIADSSLPENTSGTYIDPSAAPARTSAAGVGSMSSCSSIDVAAAEAAMLGERRGEGRLELVTVSKLSQPELLRDPAGEGELLPLCGDAPAP